MKPITFTNGNRVFTPSAQSQQFQLTDLNGDGEIDILDAALINSNPGGIVIVNPPPPTLTDDEFTPVEPFVEPQYCVDSGIILTGCNSVYRVDGTIDYPPAPDDPFFCPEGKVRGFAYVAETNSVTYISECTCPEENSAVHAANILLAFIGPGKKAAKTAAKKALIRTIATAEDSLKNAIKYRKFLNDMLKATIEGMKVFEKSAKDLETKIALLKKAAQTGIHPVTGQKLPTAYLPAAIQTLEKELFKVNRYLDRDANTIMRIKDEIAKFDALIAKFQKIKEAASPVLENLDHFDPETWVSIMMTGLIPIGQFFVPKFCGGGSRLDDQCNCVPISSGSYSSSYTNNTKISSTYNLIESL